MAAMATPFFAWNQGRFRHRCHAQACAVEAPVPTPSLGQSRPRCWQGMARPRQAWPCCEAWSRTAKQPSAGRSPSNPWWTCSSRSAATMARAWTSASRTATQGCPDFLNARYGAENVLCAAIHRDETTSHLQVLIAARHEGGRLSSSKLMGNRTALSALQDDFHEAVAKLLRPAARREAHERQARARAGAVRGHECRG